MLKSDLTEVIILSLIMQINYYRDYLINKIRFTLVMLFFCSTHPLIVKLPADHFWSSSSFFFNL